VAPFPSEDSVLGRPGKRYLKPFPLSWVFDHPFYIILNVAVGGNWPGDPDPTTSFPQQMLVDYVRVYSQSPKGAK